jgi:hypothetical protein
MKRFLILLFSLFLMLSLGMTALADVIYEPEDDFFEKHRDECYYENRVYIASGEAGFAAVKKNPTSDKTVEELPNGEEVYVSYIWGLEGGWGLMDGTGWISMKELTVKYDSLSFEQEHGREFLYPEEAEFLDLEGCSRVLLWEYPGDAGPSYTMSEAGEDAWWGWPPEEMSFNTIYEDAEGRRWGYVNYYYGIRDFWVCLSDPAGTSLAGAEPAAPPVEYAPTEPPAPTEEPASTASPTAAPVPASPEPTELPPLIDPVPPTPTLWGPAALAVGAMAVAGGLLALFRKKK